EIPFLVIRDITVVAHPTIRNLTLHYSQVDVHDCLLFYSHYNTPPTRNITLSLHDALPISPTCRRIAGSLRPPPRSRPRAGPSGRSEEQRLNSSHVSISYDVFCM